MSLTTRRTVGNLNPTVAPSEGALTLYPRLWARDASQVGVIFCHGADSTPATAELNQVLNQDGNNGNLAPLVQALAATRPVIAVNMGGQLWANDVALARVTDAYNHLTGTLGAKPGRVIIIGASMGALTAMVWARANPSRVAGIVTILPVTDVNDFVTNNRAGLASSVNAAYPSGYNNARDGGTHSPAVFKAKMAGIPHQIWYATDDTVAIPSAVTAYITALGSSPAPDTHTLTGGHSQATYAAISAATINTWIAANAAATPTTPGDIPGAPAITSTSTTSNSITVNWGTPGDGGNAITGYTVTAGALTTTAAAGATTATLTGATNGTYSVTVHATNAAGNSPESAAASAVVSGGVTLLTIDNFARTGNLGGSTASGGGTWTLTTANDHVVNSGAVTASVSSGGLGVTDTLAPASTNTNHEIVVPFTASAAAGRLAMGGLVKYVNANNNISCLLTNSTFTAYVVVAGAANVRISGSLSIAAGSSHTFTLHYFDNGSTATLTLKLDGSTLGTPYTLTSGERTAVTSGVNVGLTRYVSGTPNDDGSSAFTGITVNSTIS